MACGTTAAAGMRDAHQGVEDNRSFTGRKVMNFINSSLAILLVAASGCATVVGPGQVGVLWRASDGTQNAVYGEGRYRVARWNKMYVYDLKTMNQDESLSALTANGLTLKMDTSLRYRLMPTDVIAVHKQVGQTYYEKLVKPSLLAESRRIFAQYTAEQIYSTKRTQIERQVLDAVNSYVGGRYIAVEAFLIRDVELPLPIRAAIDQKLVIEQQLLTMQYNLAIARVTADQKQIEAHGIAGYNNTIKGSLNRELLDYTRTHSLSQLARSPNAKTVVIGPGTASPVLVETPK
jgi:regulator of protease activity HflC (stomatin/prohibitin superfamily)